MALEVVIESAIIVAGTYFTKITDMTCMNITIERSSRLARSNVGLYTHGLDNNE